MSTIEERVKKIVVEQLGVKEDADFVVDQMFAAAQAAQKSRARPAR